MLLLLTNYLLREYVLKFDIWISPRTYYQGLEVKGAASHSCKLLHKAEGQYSLKHAPKIYYWLPTTRFMKISERTCKEARVGASDPYLRHKQDFCNAWSLELDLFLRHKWSNLVYAFNERNILLLVPFKGNIQALWRSRLRIDAVNPIPVKRKRATIVRERHYIT